MWDPPYVEGVSICIMILSLGRENNLNSVFSITFLSNISGLAIINHPEGIAKNPRTI